MTDKNPKKAAKAAKSGGGAVVLLVLLALALPIAAHFYGPWHGWLDPLLRQPQPSTPSLPPSPPPVVVPVPPSPVEEAPPPVTPVPTPEVTPVEPPVFQAEALFDELLATYQRKYPAPEIGKVYAVYLKDGKEDCGELLEAEDGRILLKLEYGKVGYPIHVVSPRSYPELFPKQAAKMLAMRDFQEALKARKADNASAGPDDSTAGGAAVASAPGGRCVYDPSFAPSPENLRDTVNEFGVWIKAQQRRMGGAVAEKIYAKNHGQHAVLYLQASKKFQAQSYDFRFTVTEALWNIWAFRCLDFGRVADLNQAHIVLLGPDQKIIGGSTAEDSASIWVKK
jgi:hypothetical protein